MTKRQSIARKPTIRDIARAVGVSTTTVINVLKGRTSEVSETVAQKIQKTVSRMGYVKNLTAAALSTRKSHMIAVVVSGAFNSDPRRRSMDINPFYGDFVFRLEHEARSRGYSLGLYAGNDEGALPFLLQRQYDAVIVVGAASPTLPQKIAQQHISPILIDSFIERGNFMRVCCDEALGGSLAAQHIVSRKRRKLAFLGDVHPQWKTLIPTIRYHGALAACRKAGVALPIIKCTTSFKAGAEAAGEVIARGYDGIVTAADVLAVGLVQGLRHAGVVVPDRVAVVGYDNLLVARMSLPTLTTVDQGLDAKIRAALDLVQDPAPGKVVKVKPELVVREST